MMERTWLFPILSEGLGRLCQSGLFQRWVDLQGKLDVMWNFFDIAGSNALYRKVRQQILFQVEEGVVFEEANSVSIGALKNMLQLYCILILTGTCLFLIEISIYLRRKYRHLDGKLILYYFLKFVFELGYAVWINFAQRSGKFYTKVKQILHKGLENFIQRVGKFYRT